VLAAMANYIDAGSIVAGAVALPIWAKHFGFGDSFVSFLGAFSSNAIAAGLGALIGGRVCDLLGRKKIYQWDLLMYAFGTLWIVFATQEWMLLIGFFIVGLTVGADVPASWTLITETAPNEKPAPTGSSSPTPSTPSARPATAPRSRCRRSGSSRPRWRSASSTCR
jgi:MFS transporter, SP family, inositol transporter